MNKEIWDEGFNEGAKFGCGLSAVIFLASALFIIIGFIIASVV